MTDDLGPTETERARKQKRERESFLVLMAIVLRETYFSCLESKITCSLTAFHVCTSSGTWW